MAAHIEVAKCIGCTACVGACPTEAMSMDGYSAHVDEDACRNCGACVEQCVRDAITIAACP